MTSPRRILEERGLTAAKSRGQNFLADPNMARAIVARAEPEEGDRILEIGPGLGALTIHLLEKGARVTAVELDHGLADWLEDELAPQFPERLKVVRDDILNVDLEQLIGAEEKIKVVGNLPYLISTPVLFKLLAVRPLIEKAVLMFQKELADRLTAGPGKKDYGRLSVNLGYHADIVRYIDVGAEVFYPRPKVGSTVLGFVFREKPGLRAENEALFSRVVAAGFAKRRKTLRNSLKSAFSLDEVETALERAGIEPTRRAETLSIDEFVKLTNSWPQSASPDL